MSFVSNTGREVGIMSFVSNTGREVGISCHLFQILVEWLVSHVICFKYW